MIHHTCFKCGRRFELDPVLVGLDLSKLKVPTVMETFDYFHYDIKDSLLALNLKAIYYHDRVMNRLLIHLLNYQ